MPQQVSYVTVKGSFFSQATGIGAYLFTVVLGITSLPSVAKSMSWQEFRMVQSRLGWLVVVLSAAHIMAKGWGK